MLSTKDVKRCVGDCSLNIYIDDGVIQAGKETIRAVGIVSTKNKSGCV